MNTGKYEKGYTKTIVISAVALVVLIAGSIGYHFHEQRETPKTVTANLVDMAMKAAIKFKPQNNFRGVDSEVLVDLDVPDKDLVHGKTIVSEFGTPIIFSSSSREIDDDSLQATYSVPDSECGFFVEDAGKIFPVIAVNGLNVKAPGAAFDTKDLAGVCNTYKMAKVSLSIELFELLKMDPEFHEAMKAGNPFSAF